jgi:uncharacterized protein with WD repeat
MKKFKLLALAFVIGTASLFAMDTVDPKSTQDEIRDQIVKLLETPDFVIKNETSVVLKFTFNSEGEIVVLCAGCEDKEIVNYIRENLNYKKFEKPGERDKIYIIPLTLKAA